MLFDSDSALILPAWRTLFRRGKGCQSQLGALTPLGKRDIYWPSSSAAKVGKHQEDRYDRSA
jgi:hypothetical protein